MPVLDFDIVEHRPYADSYEQANNLPPTEAQNWTADEINLLKAVLDNHGLYLSGLGELASLNTAAKSTFVAAINSLINDASIGATEAWSASRVISYLSTATLTVSQVTGLQAALDAAAQTQAVAAQAVQDAADADAKAQLGVDNAAIAAGKADAAQTDIDARQYGAESTANLTINAALVGTQSRFHQLFNTVLGVRVATIASDIAEDQEVVINRVRGANNLQVSTGADIILPDGSLANPLVLNELGYVLMKKRSAGWVVLEFGRHS
jgi:hypothetical protein